MKSSLLRGAFVLRTFVLGLTAEAYAQGQAPQARLLVRQRNRAGSSATNQLEEVIVTAQKRSTSLQTTPLAVTALNAEALQQKQEQAQGLEDINGLVPSLKMGDVSGYAQITPRPHVAAFARPAEGGAGAHIDPWAEPRKRTRRASECRASAI